MRAQDPFVEEVRNNFRNAPERYPPLPRFSGSSNLHGQQYTWHTRIPLLAVTELVCILGPRFKAFNWQVSKAAILSLCPLRISGMSRMKPKSCVVKFIPH